MLDKIKKQVEQATGLPDIALKTRKREYINARMVYYKIARDTTSNSLAEIGDPMNVDHATVLHALINYKYFKNYKEIKRIYLKASKPFREKTRAERIQDILNALYAQETALKIVREHNYRSIIINRIKIVEKWKQNL